jgi:hypothetical protein
VGRPAIPSVIKGPAGPKPKLQLDAVEVTQSIQDHNQSVPLIANKRTFVRVYIGVTSGSPATVQGELRVARHPHGPWTVVPSMGTASLDPGRKGSTLPQLQSRRDNLAHSLNFRLPSALVGTGDVSVRLGHVSDATSTQVIPVKDANTMKTVTLIQSPPLRVRVINLQYTTGTPPVTYAASANDLGLLRSWLRRTYPVPNLVFSSVTVPTTATWPFDSGQANAQVAAIRALDMAAGADPLTHYYGLVSDGGGFMRGSAAGIPGTPDPSVVASGPTGSGTWGWDNDGSYGDWYGGHELGHTFGRFHPGFCGESQDDPTYPFTGGQLANNDDAFVGLDAGEASLSLSPLALPGTAWHDVMTYCSTQWVSSYTYAGIRDRLVAEAALFPGPIPAAPVSVGTSMTDDPSVHIAAVVNLTDRTGRIAQVTPLPGRPSPTPPPEETRLALRARSASGTTQEYLVEFKPDSDRPRDEEETGLVAAIVDVDSGVTAIELLIDGDVVATFEPGAAPGEVAHLGVKPSGAERDEEEGVRLTQRTLSWDDMSGRGPDGRSTFIVQASTDRGETWQTLAVGLADTSLPIDPGDYAHAEQVRFRVLATNGIAYTETATDDLPVDAL